MDDIALLTIRLPREEKQKLMECAVASDLSVSQLIRHLIRIVAGLVQFFSGIGGGKLRHALVFEEFFQKLLHIPIGDLFDRGG